MTSWSSVVAMDSGAPLRRGRNDGEAQPLKTADEMAAIDGDDCAGHVAGGIRTE